MLSRAIRLFVVLGSLLNSPTRKTLFAISTVPITRIFFIFEIMP